MAIYTDSSMQIPWYIGWPIVIAFGVGVLSMVSRDAPYYPIKYPSGFWQLQSKLAQRMSGFSPQMASGFMRGGLWRRRLPSSHCTCTGMRGTPPTAFCKSERQQTKITAHLFRIAINRGAHRAHSQRCKAWIHQLIGGDTDQSAVSTVRFFLGPHDIDRGSVKPRVNGRCVILFNHLHAGAAVLGDLIDVGTFHES